MVEEKLPNGARLDRGNSLEGSLKMNSNLIVKVNLNEDSATTRAKDK